jgi:hypothetical protein
MRRMIFLVSVVFFITGCSDDSSSVSGPTASNSYVFVACEGNYGASNGTVYMVDEHGNTSSIGSLGDVVQSVEVHGNKLFVIVNNSHRIMVYDITENGISEPGIEVSTGNSSPREMVVLDDKVYFTNWNTQDVKVLNLFTYQIESPLVLTGLPEDIITDGEYLYVSMPHLVLHDQNLGSEVVKIDPLSMSVLETYNVGLGPESLLLFNDEVYVARKNYSMDWNTVYYGSSKISNGVVTSSNYGTGVACGGSILSSNGMVYRTYDGGVAPLNNDLDINTFSRIGDYGSGSIYHAEEINGFIWLGLTDNTVRVINNNGAEVGFYSVGAYPGDFAVWNNQD